MAQHFLLSAAARTLSLRDIYAAGEDAAYDRFRRLRWPATDGAPVCPRCDCPDAYELATRRRFTCKACRHQFSVTSGTIFASRKLAFVDLLAAIAIVATAAKGVSTVQLSRMLGLAYKSASVLAHKLREALSQETAGLTLDGVVEVDGAWVGGHVRPANARTDRVDRRLKANRSDNRCSVIVLRQRCGRSVTTVVARESEGVAFANARIAPGATAIADETAHWDLLSDAFDVERVNHSDAYSFLQGIHINGAESLFSRLRRMIDGQHHGVSPGLLAGYAAHAAWLEDHRRQSNGALADQMIRNGLAAPVSRAWKGYWQGAK